ncbi:uncharacterized protein LOC107367767 [Tetranychus urticae]|uniref:Uncharacterized protein n=1 Tax=Tetranychus urticae TaxID=32264 RepID=T1KW00_TETUR|nr:uncharacterized protein LOC107367767 [Tetranychus urticae]
MTLSRKISVFFSISMLSMFGFVFGQDVFVPWTPEVIELVRGKSLEQVQDAMAKLLGGTRLQIPEQDKTFFDNMENLIINGTMNDVLAAMNVLQGQSRTQLPEPDNGLVDVLPLQDVTTPAESEVAPARIFRVDMFQ